MDPVSIRYIVDDVEQALTFDRDALGFTVDMNPAPGFAALSRGSLRLLLSAPGAGGAGQSMPDGSAPAPGGWNRFQFPVEDLDATVTLLRERGCAFRSEIIQGNGGRQVIVDDPSGNPVELFEPRRSEHH